MWDNIFPKGWVVTLAHAIFLKPSFHTNQEQKMIRVALCMMWHIEWSLTSCWCFILLMKSKLIQLFSNFKAVYTICKFWTLPPALINENDMFILPNAFMRERVRFHKSPTKLSSLWLLSQSKCRAPFHQRGAERKGQARFIIHKSQ